MNVFVVAMGMSVWGLSASLTAWFSSSYGHAFWWPKWCVFLFGKLPRTLQRRFKKTMTLAGYTKQGVKLWFGKASVMTTIGITGVLFSPIGIVQVLGLFVVFWSWLPLINAGRSAAARQRQAVLALPVMMDALAMLLATGIPLVSALQRGMSRNRSNALQDELQMVLQDIRMGTSLANALDLFCSRLPRPEIRLFANLLLQSSQQGNSLAPLLEQQAKTRREITAAEIEQYAQEAPVRLLGPLAICIFPATILPFVGIIIAKITIGG